MRQNSSFSVQRIEDIEKHLQITSAIAKSRELAISAKTIADAPDITCITKLTSLRVILKELEETLPNLG